MNLQSQQNFRPPIPRPIRILVSQTPQVNNTTANSQSHPNPKVYLSVAPKAPVAALSKFNSVSNSPAPLSLKNSQCLRTLSKPVPTVVRQPFQDLSSSQNIPSSMSRPLSLAPVAPVAPKAPVAALSKFNSVSNSPAPLSLKNSQCQRTLSQPMPTVVRRPFQDLSLSQNIPSSMSRPQQHQLTIPKQHPLDKELHQAKLISESVKLTFHEFPEDPNLNDEEEFSEEEFVPRKKKPITVDCTKNASEIVKRKLSVCRLKKDETKDLIAQAEENSLSEDFSKVHDILPSCSTYVVTECTSLENNTWQATIRSNIGSREEAETWLTEFENENSLDFRFRKSVDAENSLRLLFKRQYRCHHNTMPKANASKGEKSKNFQSKNTNCPAYVRITIKQKTMKWSSDYLLQAYPCEIVIRHTHNHPILCANALRRRRPSKVICEKFTSLLQKGYSPLAALECHKYDLQIEYGDDYYKVSADQSLCPSNFWVYKLYKKLCIKNYGPQTGEEMINALKNFCEEYNKECQSECAKVATTEDGQLVVAICTPLMKRASTLIKGAAEILFADSSGTMDSLNCKLFLLQTTSVAGAIPLGALIVTSERETVLNVAVPLWKSMLPENAFCGRGPNVGPKLIMTDDCSNERNALHAAFMGAILLLCLFHILQAFWRFVWNREQNVAKEDRAEVFFIFRDLVYAETEEIFLERLEYARNSEKMMKYPKVLAHLETYIPRAQEWALCYRKNLMTRGNDTNNYSEAGFKVFKDKVLGRTKAFNPVHLCEFVVTRYDAYLKGKLIDVINNRASNVFKSRFYIRPEKLVDLTSVKLDAPPNTYLVKNSSKGTDYVVVMDLEICSCPAGQSGAPCKHLSCVVQQFQLTSSLVHPLLQCNNPTIKKILFEVVHGHQNVSDTWFADLHATIQDSSNSSAVSMEVEESLETAGPESATDDAREMGNSHISDEELKILDDSLDKIFLKFKQGIREDPKYVEAVKVFISQNEKFNNSESGLLSALHTFGKTVGPLPLGFKRKRSGSAIPVQPGSKARRTVYLGGRKAQFTGRPSKAMASAPTMQDHSYGTQPKKTPGPNAWHKLPTRVCPAPHALLQCVTNNRMIGSNHSRK